MFLAYLLVIMLSFILVIYFTSYSTESALVRQKKEALHQEAQLLSQDVLLPYYNGQLSSTKMKQKVKQLATTMDHQIWLADNKGNIIINSANDSASSTFVNITTYEKDILNTSFSSIGNFHNEFSEKQLSYGIPIYNEEKVLCYYVIYHVPLSQLSAFRSNIALTAYMAFFILIIISFLFLSRFANKILRPLAKINHVARQYASGNFDITLDIKRDDEIGELATSLNYMAGELSRADEYRRSFIANISHDFRSPLTSIKGYVEAILDGTIPPELEKKYLNVVLMESNRLAKLTSSLLTLNNLDNYDVILHKTTFNIVEVIQSISNTFEVLCNKKNIQLVTKYESEESLVFADQSKIQQVLYNLIDNAIKFSHENSIIRIEVSEKNTKYFISVKDFGDGIEKSKQKLVWDRFYKTDTSRGKDKQGTGLGLSIIKEIMKAHKENINLVSTEGVGSEFIFSLPKGSKYNLKQ